MTSPFVRLSMVVLVLASAVVSMSAQPTDTSAPRMVQITAERFMFTPSEITVPQGTTIEFRLKSEDTAHGFRILGQAIDFAIPKRGRGEGTVRFTPPNPGTYVFECSRMCGAGHSFMRGTIKVRPQTTEKSQ